MNTLVLQGILEEIGDEPEGLGVTPGYNFIAKSILEHMDVYGQYLTVRYWISDEARSVVDIEKQWIKIILGVGEGEFYAKYSEITGYLWTNEELEVGGHDLMEELYGYLGKYLYMEVEASISPNLLETIDKS